MTNSLFKFLGKFKPIVIQCSRSVRIPLTCQRFWYAIIILIHFKRKYNTIFPESESYKKSRKESSYQDYILFHDFSLQYKFVALLWFSLHIFLRLFYPFGICMTFLCYLIMILKWHGWLFLKWSFKWYQWLAIILQFIKKVNTHFLHNLILTTTALWNWRFTTVSFFF